MTVPDPDTEAAREEDIFPSPFFGSGTVEAPGPAPDVAPTAVTTDADTEAMARFLPLSGQVVGLDFEHEGVTVVQVAIPSAGCPPIGKQRVHLWVYAEMTADEWTQFDA